MKIIFVLNLGAHTESQTELFIWTTGIEFSNSVNHDQVQVVSYSKYSLLVLPIVGIKPATFRWFLSETPPYQTPNSLRHMSLNVTGSIPTVG